MHRKYHHDEMTFSMVYAYSENYVLPISHDEVVHGKRALVSKMPGDWWQQRANHRAYLGFMWAHPGKQLLFMGQEFAQGAEWSEAHGPDWWLLDPAYAAEADHRGVRDLVRDLNRGVRGRRPRCGSATPTRPASPGSTADAAEDNVFSFLRFAPTALPLLAVSNFSPVVRARLPARRARTRCPAGARSSTPTRRGTAAAASSTPVPSSRTRSRATAGPSHSV